MNGNNTLLILNSARASPQNLPTNLHRLISNCINQYMRLSQLASQSMLTLCSLMSLSLPTLARCRFSLVTSAWHSCSNSISLLLSTSTLRWRRWNGVSVWISWAVRNTTSKKSDSFSQRCWNVPHKYFYIWLKRWLLVRVAIFKIILHHKASFKAKEIFSLC